MNFEKQEKRQNTGEKKSRKKKEKRAQRGTNPRWAPKKIIFHIRTVKRNRNEIEARKKIQILSTQQKKENERK